MTNVRVAAAETLLAVGGANGTLAAELERARAGLADRRDRALLIELAAGVLRWKGELDAIIVAASRRRLDQIDLRALAVLEIGAYQSRHLERIPPHAIVNESVNAVRALGAPRAAAFVNAVLRKIVGRHDFGLPPRPPARASEAACLAYLSVSLSHPQWLVARWMRRYGFDAAARWCEFNNASPEVTIRSTHGATTGELLARLEHEQIAAEPAPFAPGALRLLPGVLGRISPELLAEVIVQDEGSQLVARVAGARAGERVLDVCASPGGKTLVLADDMTNAASSPASLLVAGDLRPSRVALLAGTVQQAPLRVPVLALNALSALPFLAVFDCVLLDAPCSGLGTLRRDPDLKWSRKESDIPRLAADALRMLIHAADVVRPGGRLVYATCSSEPEENQGVVDRFLASDHRFVIDHAAARRVVPPDLVDEQGYLVTLPFRHGLDAFFAATLVRRPAA